MVRILMTREVADMYEMLKQSSVKSHKSIINAINRIKLILENNPGIGVKIPKNIIPDKFKQTGVTHLFRIELPNYWRLTYRIETNGNVIITTLEDHKSYNKTFSYD